MTQPTHHRAHHLARRPDESMSLLNEVMYRPVDLGYVEAAQQRALVEARGTPRARRGSAAVALVVAAFLGAFTVAAVAGLRAPQEGALEGRTLLLSEIEQRSGHAAAVEAERVALTAEVTALQETALRSVNPGLLAQVERSSLLAGTTAVSGPGLVVNLTDAADAGDSGVPAAARVQAIDLQIVVNDLWAAGAEAVAVNGSRLTALSAIRGAGQAIFIDARPLLSPYRIEAIGDGPTLQTRFARSYAAEQLSLIQAAYGIRSSVQRVEELTLEGASAPRLRHARSAVDVASSVGGDERGTP